MLFATIAKTRISGDFHLLHADLGAYRVIKGDLTAAGRFDGTLGRAEVLGRAEIPDFEVRSSHHSLRLTTEYRAFVDGTAGNVAVESAEAHFLGTTLTAHGTVNGKQGKAVSLDFNAPQARIEDLLRIFVTADRSPLEGLMSLHTHVVLPPAPQPLIKRVQLDGGFTISDANFTNPITQREADELSLRAPGKRGDLKRGAGRTRVTEDFKATVSLRGAIATITDALFAVPGAAARGAGMYDVMTEAIDLRGDLAMHASLSKAAGGFKSALLTPLDPFFKKPGAGAAFLFA